MPNPDNLNGKGFDIHPERINRNGRPVKLVTQVLRELKEMGYEPVKDAQIAEVYLMLMNLPASEISRIASKGIFVKETIENREETVFLQSDKDYPFLVRMVAKAMMIGKGIEIIERMADRAIGKPKQAVDITSKGEKINDVPLTNLTDDELRVLAEFQRKCRTGKEEPT